MIEEQEMALKIPPEVMFPLELNSHLRDKLKVGIYSLSSIYLSTIHLLYLADSVLRRFYFHFSFSLYYLCATIFYTQRVIEEKYNLLNKIKWDEVELRELKKYKEDTKTLMVRLLYKMI